MKKLTPLFILMILVFSGCSTESLEDQGQISSYDLKGGKAAAQEEAIDPMGFYSGNSGNLKGTVSVTNDCDNLFIEIIPTGDDPEDAKLGVFSDGALPGTSGQSGNIKTDDFSNLPENSLTWTIPLNEETSFNIFIKAWSTWAGAESTDGINQNYITYTVDYSGCNEVCTHGWGYWKTHSINDRDEGNQDDAWANTEFSEGMQLGDKEYTRQELNDILEESVKGNGLISLAHQLIAAKLNVANGVDDSTIAQTIVDADAMISSLIVPPVGSGSLTTAEVESLKTALGTFNNSNPCDDDSDTEE